MPRDRLTLVLPGVVSVRAGRVEMPPKTLSGLRAYAHRWPGSFTVVGLSGRDENQHHLGETWHAVDDLPFDVISSTDPEAAIRGLRPAVVLLPLQLRWGHLMGSAHRVVSVADNPPYVPVVYHLMESLGRSQRIRVRLGGVRQGLNLVRMAASGSGMMCNGPLTYSFYRPFNQKCLLFFDSRITDQDISESTVTAPERSRMKLGFSGRWVVQKGVLDAIHAARASGHEIDIIGGGPLASEIAAKAFPGAAVIGNLDFDSEWKRYVRENVDLMILPHPQPDSSSTYLESMACGVPVLGYANAYWKRLAAVSGGGAAVHPSTVPQLSEAIVSMNRRQWGTYRQSGLMFAASHTLEKTFDRRVAFLRAIADI